MGERTRVVVTGLGLATPLGLCVEENWQKALAGISGITSLCLPQAEGSPIQAVGAITEDWKQIADAFPREAATEGERRTLFALWATQAALSDAGVLGLAGRRDRRGVSLAAGLGIVRLEDILRWLSAEGEFDLVRFGRGLGDIHRESLLRNPSDRPAALIAGRFGLGGPNYTVTTACASATQALGIAYKAIQRGDADLMVAGGADSMINPLGLVSFVLLQAAATASARPQDLCRPFDRRRSGLVMGEGAGVAILESEGHARGRRARIYAEVAGYGSSMDAYQVTAPHPEGRGAAQAMRRALQDGNLEPSAIDYINAHGTGTKLNDVAETLAIKRVFGEWAHKMAISSSKSLIGHLMAAAGGPEFVYTVLAVHRDEIHPTINLRHPDPRCDLDYVPNVKRARRVRAAVSNSFGFGGQNASIVVTKYGGGAAEG
jgi:3-oxoacyl-[acyl-carrier-protein] synthase II